MTTEHAIGVHLDTPAVQVARDLVLLVARVGLAVIMLAHAKFFYDLGGLGGVGQMFAQSGVPLPGIAGPANVLFEFVGGIALLLGLAVPIVGALMAVNMVGAWIFMHPGSLFSMEHNGPELVITIGLLSLVLAVVGSGRFGLDHLIRTRSARRGQ
ncbi:MAG: DoxX family protein [Actinophytocola sp.]|uniref:DoxX family protein n=1 Tax=Actinophytocola sp. TaxID=1872138 RepID=UPI003C78EE49